MGLDDNPALKRADLSTFVFHLTKDGPDDSVDAILEERPAKATPTARQNLIAILKDVEVKARAYHSLFGSELKKSDKATRDAFRVVCFSEAPLIVLDDLVVPKRKGNIKIKPYGVIFTRQRMVSFGANEAFYLGADSLKNAEWARFNDWLKSNPRPSPGTLPIVNLLSEKYDFTWEREWRFIGDFFFCGLENISGVVLPSIGEGDLVQLFHKYEVPVIHPGMTQLQIDDEMKRNGPTDSMALHKELRSL